MTLKQITTKLMVAVFACAMTTTGMAVDNVGFVYVSPIGDAG